MRTAKGSSSIPTERSESSRRVICFAILILVGLVPRLLFGAWGVSDGFAFTTTALASNSLNTGQVEFAPYPEIGGTVQAHANDISLRFFDSTLAAVYTLFGGGSVKAFQFLPTAGISFLILSYALGLRVLRRAHLALAFALFLSYEPVTESLTYNWYPQGWAFSLYFVFSILFVRYMAREGSLSTRLAALVLMLLTYAAIFFTYYAAEMYVIVLATVVAALGLLRAKGHSVSEWREPRTLAIVLVATFVFFEPSFYWVAVLGGQNQLRNPFSVISDALSGTLPGGDAGSSRISALYTNAGVALYVVLLFFTLAGALIIMRRAMKERRVPPEFRVYWALAITGALDVAIYSSLGYLSLKLIMILFPLLALFTVAVLFRQSNSDRPNHRDPDENRLRRHKLKRSLLVQLVVILLLAFVFARFVGFKQTQVRVDYGYTDAGMSWIVSHVRLEGKRVFGDLLYMEKLLVESTSVGITKTTFIPVSQNLNFGFAYDDNCTGATQVLNQFAIDFVLISQLDIQLDVSGANWRVSGPLLKHAAIFGTCPVFNLIYSDGAIYFYEVTA